MMIAPVAQLRRARTHAGRAPAQPRHRIGGPQSHAAAEVPVDLVRGGTSVADCGVWPLAHMHFDIPWHLGLLPCADLPSFFGGLPGYRRVDITPLARSARSRSWFYGVLIPRTQPPT